MACGKAAVAIVALLCSACSVRSNLPRGPAAHALFSSTESGEANDTYLIGPLDTVSVAVFQEPDLSAQNAQVDAEGDVLLPLVGSVHAAGKSPPELASLYTAKLKRYLKSPRVTVTVNSITQKVAVEGSVHHPGLYEVRGRSSLLEALAMAQSPTRVAALDEVIIFRQSNGARTGAVFDVRRIRAGLDPDPLIRGGDRIVVGYSWLKGAWRDFLSTTPMLNAFARF
jgi:polysaccharide export outer membrane protein